ncbi:uncharacterized protein LOC124279326 [Haliotis rubra]|uniref:uncharacterized protein LOC124279326 n=1 Tax=Haliotis rubra TaxID=36100 RepID=UPI001EE4FB39|nr:uncharacterized protein LOC124279326 [Haliotis rubra]
MTKRLSGQSLEHPSSKCSDEPAQEPVKLTGLCTMHVYHPESELNADIVQYIILSQSSTQDIVQYINRYSRCKFCMAICIPFPGMPRPSNGRLDPRRPGAGDWPPRGHPRAGAATAGAEVAGEGRVRASRAHATPPFLRHVVVSESSGNMYTW